VDKGEQRSNEGSLSGVEGSPGKVLGNVARERSANMKSTKSNIDEIDYVLVRADRTGGNHGTEAERETADADDPRVRHHQTVDEASLHHLPGRQANDSDTQTSVQEGVVEVLALKGRHAAVLSGLAVEDGVDGDERTAEDGTADQEPAHARLVGLRRVRVAAVGSEGVARQAGAHRRGRRNARREEAEAGLGRLLVEASHGRLGQLLRQPLRQAHGGLADGECKGHGG
jgi:hypothetical protein